jgi:hypothetical protein
LLAVDAQQFCAGAVSCALCSNIGSSSSTGSLQRIIRQRIIRRRTFIILDGSLKTFFLNRRQHLLDADLIRVISNVDQIAIPDVLRQLDTFKP